MQFEEGAIVSGKITGLTDFGAFVEIEGGKTGMIHISEVAPNYVKDIREHVSVGQEVKAKIISVSPEGKISLSIRKLTEQPKEKEQRPQRPPQKPRSERRPAPNVWNQTYVSTEVTKCSQKFPSKKYTHVDVSWNSLQLVSLLWF